MREALRSFREKIQKWMRRGKPAAGGSPAQPASEIRLSSLPVNVTGGPSRGSRRDVTQNTGVVGHVGSQPPAQNATATERQTPGSSLAGVSIKHGPGEVTNCWTSALSKLDDKQRNIIQELKTTSPPNDVPQEPSKWVKSLMGDCQAWQQQRANERSQWHIHVLGKDILVRELLDDMIETLEKGFRLTEKASKLALSVDPVHAVAPYLLVKTLLAVPTANSRQEGALYIGLQKVLPIMFRCQLYEREINTARSSRTPEEIDGFETALVNLCACVLSFLCAAQEVCKTNAIRRTFHALWDPETIVDFEKTYLSLEKAVQTEAAANRGHVFINFKDELVTEIYPRIFGMHETVEVLKTKCDNEERVKILKWVSSIPVEDDHKDRSKHRTKGTCEWILERSEFLQWKESQSPLILWIHGIPGAGKTKLVSNIIDEFKQRSDSTERQNYAYFYCKKGDNERQDPESVLGSFVKQLALADGPAFSILRHEYAAKERSAFLSKKLSIEEYEKVLKGIISSSRKTFFIILDALDECREETRGILLSSLDALVGSGLPVKILISSRRDADIERRLQEKVNIGIEATDNKHDINTYVESRITRYVEDRSLGRNPVDISPALKQKIINVFEAKSNGMFLWAKLHLDHILSRGLPSLMEDDLGKLPQGIDDTFRGTIERINSDKQGLRHIGLGALKWLLSHDEDCGAEDLLAAVCYDAKVEHGSFDAQDSTYAELKFNVDARTIITACSNLVEYKEDSWKPTFRFIHLSVREYLKRLGWKPDAHAFAAEKCLHSLLDLQRLRPSLTEHASRKWIFHFQQADKVTSESSTHLVLLKAFVGPPGVFSPYYEALCRGNQLGFTAKASNPTGSHFRVPRDDNIFKSHFVCVVFYLGFETTFTLLTSPTPRNFVTDLYPNLNPKEFSDDQPGFALSPATTRDMLEQYIGILSLNGNTPVDVLWYLLANCRLRALGWQADDRLMEHVIETLAGCIVKHTSGAELAMLLGATMNLVLSQRSKPVQVSERKRLKHIECIKVLLQQGARPVPSSFEQPLGYRWLSTVEELLRAEYLYNAEYLYKGEAVWSFRSCSNQGIIDVLRTLPRGSAELTPQELSRLVVEPAFHDTTIGRYGLGDHMVADFLQALVSVIAGTNISTGTINAAVHQEFLSPMLLWATHHSRVRSCKVLLTAGTQPSADVTATSANYLSGKYGSALIAACAIGDPDVCLTFINNLIEHPPGGEQTSLYGQYLNALIATSMPNDKLRRTRSEDISETDSRPHIGLKILDHGANINTVDYSGNFESILIAACARGNFELCQTLLDHGADVNTVDYSGNFGTALIAACAHGNLEICRFLLEHGADANAICSAGTYRTALIAAASWSKTSENNWSRLGCHQDILRDSALRLQMCNLLLEHKADVNAVVRGDGSGYIGTALIASCLRDDASLCQRLIDCGAKVNLTSGGLYRTAFSAAEYADERVAVLSQEELNEQSLETIKRAMQKPGEPLKPVKTIRGKALRLLLKEYTST